jgi:ribosomal protein L7/L12
VIAAPTYNMDMEKGGVKHDGDKLQWHLLPMVLLEGVVRVLMHGAQKYAAWNWTKGMPFSRTLNAAKRHIVAFEEGEELDPDSQLHHIDHAICCLIFLRFNIQSGVKERDDRYPMRTAEQRDVRAAVQDPGWVVPPGWEIRSGELQPETPAVRLFLIAPAPEREIATVKAVRALTGLGLKEAIELVNLTGSGDPQRLKGFATSDAAWAARAEFLEIAPGASLAIV